MMELVSWDDDIPNIYIWKVIKNVPNHQPVLVDPTDPTDARLDSNHWQFSRLLAKNHGAEGGCVDIGSIGKAGNSRLKHHFS